MTMKQNCVITKSSKEQYEPFMIGEKQVGEVSWLSQINSDNVPTFSGFWRCEPMTFEYDFPGDEYIHVLDGDLNIKIGDDEYDLNRGDIALFKKGIKSVWTIRQSFKKFFVIDNC